MRVALFVVVLTGAAALAKEPAEPAAGTVAKPARPKQPPARSTLPPETIDLAVQVKELFRVAACGSDDALPERFSAKPSGPTWARMVEAHCHDMAELYASYKRAWADKAAKFIAQLRPASLPKTVVYPFGGGDLTSALVVYPDAQEITTLSLEAAGDARVIDTIGKAQLDEDLATISHDVGRLYRSAHSTTKSLQAASHSELPGTLMFALAALAVHGMEPVSLKYFDIEPDGSLEYISSGELDRRVAELATRLPEKQKHGKHFWFEQQSVFANVEIQFRKRGDGNAPLRTYRHIVANLDDAHMTKDGRVLVHLAAKGKVSVMTKAASFLLWWDDFSQIRSYLLGNMAWMISDASGIPPSYAAPAGFEQITYGTFTGPYFIQDPINARAQFVKLWKQQPQRPLPFRFGYPDQDKHPHLVITRPKAQS